MKTCVALFLFALLIIISESTAIARGSAPVSIDLVSSGEQHLRNSEWPEAFKDFNKAAQEGNVQAKFWIGWMHESRKNDAIAVCWYYEAAIKGHAKAQNNLGLFYKNGRGVVQSDAAAASWFQEAVNQGDANAQTNLGLMYEKGRGVPKDYHQAIYYYNLAKEQGHQEALRNLDFLLEKMTQSGKKLKISYGQCEICHAEIDAVFVPCGHLVACEKCSKKLPRPKKCSKCNQPIKKLITIKRLSM
jgi:TPR repeat protein